MPTAPFSSSRCVNQRGAPCGSCSLGFEQNVCAGPDRRFLKPRHLWEGLLVVDVSETIDDLIAPCILFGEAKVFDQRGHTGSHELRRIYRHRLLRSCAIGLKDEGQVRHECVLSFRCAKGSTRCALTTHHGCVVRGSRSRYPCAN